MHWKAWAGMPQYLVSGRASGEWSGAVEISGALADDAPWHLELRGEHRARRVDLGQVRIQAVVQTDEALATVNPEAGAPSTLVEQLKAANNGHPGWPALRDWQRTVLANDPEFQGITQTLLFALASSEEAILRCY